ncbi:NAD(P)/FAD-dependent oxidoreductase [Roseateles oligotrophus]|uniref:FAD-dependent oxidoreductase n=1 Tax=Roseateles oligotrophus TaxID=1769250 RepID=A0ABT2Y9V6_9BURK|nr:FAD-dependent oxidoreductase [Roseateles oligotrophus]MCV2367079.1 FAD-dependent oxidoreductase [Roseateles oligotrophus]
MSCFLNVAVIGAGLAGLSCATALQAAGYRVTVFEKSLGPAGRMSTRRGEGWQCDHGAQYFTARSGAFSAELARWVDAGVAKVWAPRLAVLGDATLHRADAALQRYVGMPQMTAPAHWLASALSTPLKTGMPIERLQRVGSAWRLQVGAALLDDDFDAVLLALPAPQAAALLQDCAPALAQQAAAVPMRPSWALMLNYCAPLELGFDAAFVNQGPLRWVARNSSKPGRSGAESWLLHAQAEWSEARLHLPAEPVAAALQAAFAALGAPPAERWSAHRWLYADMAAPHGGPAARSIWDQALGLGLCGDWLGAGKVEGAWLSGQGLAQQLPAAAGRAIAAAAS